MKVYILSEYRCTENEIYPHRVSVYSCKCTASNDVKRRLKDLAILGYAISNKDAGTSICTKENDKYIITLFERNIDNYEEQEKSI